MSTKKLSPEYYESSKQRNSKKFFKQIMPGIMKDLGLDKEEIKKARKGKPDPLSDKEMREAITRIVRKYDIHLVSLTRNIQWTLDVELDKISITKNKEKMEEEIRGLGSINDIFYRDIT